MFRRSGSPRVFFLPTGLHPCPVPLRDPLCDRLGCVRGRPDHVSTLDPLLTIWFVQDGSVPTVRSPPLPFVG